MSPSASSAGPASVAAEAGLDLRAAALSQGLADIESLDVGIVRWSDEILSERTGAQLYTVAIEAADPEPVLGARTGFSSGANGLDRRTTRAAALGETVERYSASWAPSWRLRRGCLEQFGDHAPAAERLRPFLPSQYAEPELGYRPLEDDTPLSFVPGTSLARGGTCLLPAQFVYLHADAFREEEPVLPRVSTGLACGSDPWMAARSAVCEAVERDAFMLTWNLQLAPRRVQVSADRTLRDLWAARIRRLPAELTAFDLSPLGGLPTVLAVISCERRRRRGWAGLVVGAASAPTPRQACHKAILEALQSYEWTLTLRWDRHKLIRVRELEDTAKVRRFEDHVLYWMEPDRLAQAAFLWDHDETIRPTEMLAVKRAGRAAPDSPGDGRSCCRALVGALAEHGVEVCLFDVTSADIATTGLTVARAVGPDLCWLDVSHDQRMLGRPRYPEVARRVASGCLDGLRPSRRVRMDQAGTLSRVEHFNPAPHPFP